MVRIGKYYLSIYFALLLSISSFADEVPEGEFPIDEVIEEMEVSENVDFEPGVESGEQSFEDSEQSDPISNEDYTVEIIIESVPEVTDPVQESEVEIISYDLQSNVSNPVLDGSEITSEGEILSNTQDIEGLIEPNGLVDYDDNNILYVGEESSDLQSKIDRFEDLLNTEKVDLFSQELIGSEDLTDWDIADYFKNVVTQALFDIFGEPSVEELDEEEEYEVLIARDGYDYIKSVKNSLDDEIRQLYLNREGTYKNVVVYHGVFNEYECDLIIPYEDYQNLIVRDGFLINVGKSAVTGKILYEGDSLDPTEYDSYVYVLNPIYGSTANVYQYGNFNYRRHYFLSATGSYERITSQDMYGGFYVDDIDVYYSSTQRVYVCLMVIILFMGVNIIWKRL